MSFSKTSRILVIMGGLSEERPVSLRTGQAVCDALVNEGYVNTGYYVVDDETLPRFPKSVDVAFIAMHGRFGEDGVLQAMLEQRSTPYTGSEPGSSRVCIDKTRAKEVFDLTEVPTPRACVFDTGIDLSEIEKLAVMKVGLPAVVKPVSQGSSVGVSIVKDGIELLLGVTAAFQFSETVMVEEYIAGRELTVGILDGEALPIIEIRSKRGFFDYSAKYEDKRTTYKVKPKIGRALARSIQEQALQAFDGCGCRHFGRVDLRLSNKGKPYFIEINTIPGLTKRSLFPMAAKAAGLSYGQLCVKLCELACEGSERAEVA
jgi:D-alanine-D-alanine ligase